MDKLHPFYTGVDSWRSLPAILTEQIAHFFQHYKDLEKGKSTSITGWADAEETAQIIRDCDRALPHEGRAPAEGGGVAAPGRPVVPACAAGPRRLTKGGLSCVT